MRRSTYWWHQHEPISALYCGTEDVAWMYGRPIGSRYKKNKIQTSVTNGRISRRCWSCSGETQKEFWWKKKRNFAAGDRGLGGLKNLLSMAKTVDAERRILAKSPWIKCLTILLPVPAASERASRYCSGIRESFIFMCQTIPSDYCSTSKNGNFRSSPRFNSHVEEIPQILDIISNALFFLKLIPTDTTPQKDTLNVLRNVNFNLTVWLAVGHTDWTKMIGLKEYRGYRILRCCLLYSSKQMERQYLQTDLGAVFNLHCGLSFHLFYLRLFTELWCKNVSLFKTKLF